jgi:LuxR family transcriptional regulator, maltose regulon positive regulatory protein
VARTDRIEADDAPVTRSATGGVVGRRALFERLAGAGRVTLVSAPAGSGKTLLLRSWIAEMGLADHAAWVEVPREHRDSQRFWIAVLDALRATVLGSTLVGPLTAAPEMDGWAIVERLLTELDALEDSLWLVLDDLHELRSTDALAQLQLLLMRSPPELRFVLTTRRDLRLGLHRLRLEGSLTEIRAPDLPFTVEESRALLEAAGVVLPEAALSQLVERTEGWAAGLRLAALSLARHPDPERFAAEFSGSERTVAEYLLAEVLDVQSEEVRLLLLRTSILERVSGPLADLLTEGTGGERILQELEEANAFIAALDAKRSWFRYHYLFAELLQSQLRRSAPGEVTTLHAAAATWYGHHEYPIEAIRHAQAAEDWRLAAQLLADHWECLYLNGQFATAHELLAGFPSRAAEADPELAEVTAKDKLVQGSFRAAEEHLAMADRDSASVAGDRRDLLQVRLAVARLGLARRRGDLTAVVEQARRLLAPAEVTAPAWVALGEDVRASALINLGVAELWDARVAQAERHLEQGIALAQRIERPFLELTGLAHLAMIASVRSFRLAGQRSRQAIELARQHGWTDEPVTGLATAALGGTLTMQGRFEEAEQWLEHAEGSLWPEAEPAAGQILHTARGLLHMVGGRNQDALRAFGAAERLADLLVSPHPFAGRWRAYRLHTLLRMGETEQVEQAIAALDQQDRDTTSMRTVVAALQLAQGDPSAATDTLAPVLDRDPKTHSGVWLVQALLLEAIARDTLGDRGAADRALERALDRAEPDRLLASFLLFPVPDLLERHRHHTAHAALVADILDLLSGHQPPPSRAESEPLREPLSDSEIRILRYLPTNLSAPEIAAELYVSVHTVKTHMRHVYAKLGSHRRAEAVERARALGLLAPSARER